MTKTAKVIDMTEHKTRRSPTRKPYGLAEYERTKEQRALEAQRLERYEFMRDDLMSLVKNSGMSFEDIHGRCGPHPSTLENWAQKKILRPQLGKMISVMRIIGLTEFLIKL